MGSSDSSSFDPSKAIFEGQFENGRPIFKREQSEPIGSAPTTPRGEKDGSQNNNNLAE